MIGLIDFDLVFCTEKLPETHPNLEIMKIAAFYKRKNVPVRLIVDLAEIPYYDKIYFFSHLPIKKIPKELKGRKNTIYRGFYFTGNYHASLDIPEIEYEHPFPMIYKEWLEQQISQNLMTFKEVDGFLARVYLRFHSAEGLPLPLTYSFPEINRQEILIYDDELTRNDWYEKLEKVMLMYPRILNFVYPIRCHSFEDLKHFQCYFQSFMSLRSTDLLVDFEIKPSEANSLIRKHAKAILDAPNVRYVFSKSYRGEKHTEEFLCQNLIDNLNVLYVFWANGVTIYPYFEKILEDNPYERMFISIGNWGRKSSGGILKVTLKEHLNKEKTKRAFAKFLQTYPETERLFLQKQQNIAEGGYWNI